MYDCTGVETTDTVDASERSVTEVPIVSVCAVSILDAKTASVFDTLAASLIALIVHRAWVLVVAHRTIVERDMLTAAYRVTCIGRTGVAVKTKIDDPICALTGHTMRTAGARVPIVAWAEVLQHLGDTEPPDASSPFTGDSRSLLTL